MHRSAARNDWLRGNTRCVRGQRTSEALMRCLGAASVASEEGRGDVAPGKECSRDLIVAV